MGSESDGLRAIALFLGKTALATDPADAYEDSRANPFVRR
jgi:hypothetical protein